MNIGLVAHDSKKKLMQNFCIAYRGILAKNQLRLPTSRYINISQDIWEVPSSLVHRSSTMKLIS